MKKLFFVVALLIMAFASVGVSAAATVNTTRTVYADGSTVEKTVRTEEKKNSDGSVTKTVTTTVVTVKVIDGVKTTITETTVDEETTTVEKTSKTVTKTTNSSSSSSSSTTKKSKIPARYKDVTKKRLGTRNYKAIERLRKKGVFNGVFTGKRFYPNKKITKKQYLKMLSNAYKGAAPKDKQTNSTISSSYAKKKLLQVAKNKGMSLKWAGDSHKVTRLEAVQYITVFAAYDKALKF